MIVFKYLTLADATEFRYQSQLRCKHSARHCTSMSYLTLIHHYQFYQITDALNPQFPIDGSSFFQGMFTRRMS